MDNLAIALTGYQQLLKEWNRSPPRLEICGQLLSELKVSLTNLSFLPTYRTNITKQELLVTRGILEIGAQWSILQRDIPSFERYMAQLKFYYLNWEDAPKSACKCHLLGIYLVFLLSQNRVAEFYTELELLSDEVKRDDNIKFAISVEKNLMDGCYYKIFLNELDVPSSNFQLFLDILLTAVREEIADSLQNTFGKLSLTKATRILLFKNPYALREFANKRGWKINGENFIEFDSDVANNRDAIPAVEIASQAIGYATDLRKIV